MHASPCCRPQAVPAQLVLIPGQLRATRAEQGAPVVHGHLSHTIILGALLCYLTPALGPAAIFFAALLTKLFCVNLPSNHNLVVGTVREMEVSTPLEQ